MKKLLAVLLSAFLLVGLAACRKAEFPFVIFQGHIYYMNTASADGILYALDADEEKIGRVSSYAPRVRGAADGASNCCIEGDDIYGADDADCIYVYTAAFSTDGNARFLRFRLAVPKDVSKERDFY